jgi:hypothetical protein
MGQFLGIIRIIRSRKASCSEYVSRMLVVGVGIAYGIVGRKI